MKKLEPRNNAELTDIDLAELAEIEQAELAISNSELIADYYSNADNLLFGDY